MRKTILMIATLGSFTLAACDETSMTRGDRQLAGGLAGATAGYLTANALNANDEWTVVAALAGAAIGAKVAENRRTGECAYYRGDGTYYVRRC